MLTSLALFLFGSPVSLFFFILGDVDFGIGVAK